MTYRDMAVSVCKLAGKDLVERAEELIPDTEGVISIDICIHIPSMTDDPYCVPEMNVTTTVYPKRQTRELIIDQAIQFRVDEHDTASDII